MSCGHVLDYVSDPVYLCYMFYAKIRFNKEVRGHEVAPILAVGHEPDLNAAHPGVVRQGEGGAVLV